MRIEDIDITQESVEKFFDEINTEALADSIRMYLEAHDGGSTPHLAHNDSNIKRRW